MSYHSKMKNPATDQLFEAILRLESIEECYRFFDDICTIKEIRSLAQRLQVARLLLAGETYERIRQLAADQIVVSKGESCKRRYRLKR